MVSMLCIASLLCFVSGSRHYVRKHKLPIEVGGLVQGSPVVFVITGEIVLAIKYKTLTNDRIHFNFLSAKKRNCEIPKKKSV